MTRNTATYPIRSRAARIECLTMAQSLETSLIRVGFPAWRALRGQDESQPINFTLKRDDHYRIRNSESCIALFHMSSDIVQNVRHILQTVISSAVLHPSHIDTTSNVLYYTRFTIHELSRMIFGSNMIEKAGLDFRETIKLCKEVFEGKEVIAGDMDEYEYAAGLEFITVRKFAQNPGRQHVIRARREVIQHAQALRYLIDQTLHSNLPLSRGIILETHRILCKDIQLTDPSTERGETADTPYWGQFRTCEVGAGSVMFTHPDNLDQAMTQFVNDFNGDIEKAEASGQVDPFFLAADVCQDFVCIHPFRDGNGRMCRLLANAFLMMYAGICVTIGETEQDREEYLEIARLAGDLQVEGRPELGGTKDCEEEARGRLASFILQKAKGTLQELQMSLWA